MPRVIPCAICNTSLTVDREIVPRIYDLRYPNQNRSTRNQHGQEVRVTADDRWGLSFTNATQDHHLTEIHFIGDIRYLQDTPTSHTPHKVPVLDNHHVQCVIDVIMTRRSPNSTIVVTSRESSLLIEADDRVPSTMDELLVQSRRSATPRIHINVLEEDAWCCFFIHKQCWDLLQAVSATRGLDYISPKQFWTAAVENDIEAKRYPSSASRDSPVWLNVPGEKIWELLSGTKDRKEEGRLRQELIQANASSNQWKDLDLDLRKQVWHHLEAWVYESADDFDSEVPEDALDTEWLDDISSIHTNTSMQHSYLAKVPVEIIQAIAYQTEDIESVICLALTCKSLCAALLPVLNQYSVDVKTSQLWYLPLTKREKQDFLSVNSEDGDTSEVDGRIQLPWYRYIKQCRHMDNYSMRNRFRIWKIVNFICDDLIERDLHTKA